MLKNFRFLLDFIKTERTYKFISKKYEKHVKKFPNLARLAFDLVGLKVSIYGRFENDELKVLENNVFNKIDCSNSTCLDIGANIGNHSVFFSNFFANVYSFEPHPDNYYLLKFNTRKFNNIKIFNFGSSNIDENKYIFTPNAVDMGFSIVDENILESIKDKNKRDKVSRERIKIELKNLDNYLESNKVEKIKFIKIDVESYEYQSLIGLKNIINKNYPIIALEQHEGQFDKIKKTTTSIEFLKENSYNFFYEPIFLNRKKNKNKILRAASKLFFYLQILFTSKNEKLFKLKKIEAFEVTSYPMIIASTIDLNL